MINLKKPYIDSIDFDLNKEPTKEYKNSDIEIPDKVVILIAVILVVKVVVLFTWIW